MQLRKNYQIGRQYEVEQMLSDNGGTASIYLCKTIKDREISVVVKMSKVNSNQPGHENKLLEREAMILSSWDFRHPGVVRVFPIETSNNKRIAYSLKDIEQPERPSYMVMEYLQGGAMSSPENKRVIKKASVEWKVECFYQIAIAVASLHIKGYGHRDLKPDNICFRESINSLRAPTPVLIDFALTTDGENHHDAIVDKAMTLEYSPPERVLRSMGSRYEGMVEDPIKSDIYSLGIILYELLTGELPFKGNRERIRTTVVQDNFSLKTDKISKQNNENASVLAAMIREMTQKDFERRPTIKQIINAIDFVFRPPLIQDLRKNTGRLL